MILFLFPGVRMSIFYKLGVENKDASAVLCDGMEMSIKVGGRGGTIYLLVFKHLTFNCSGPQTRHN